MSRSLMFTLYFTAIFLQVGAYGLTFMLPRLFAAFGANEAVVGAMLFVTTLATLVTVCFAGHLSDLFGRIRTLGLACIAIAASLFLFGAVERVGPLLVLASALLGVGWGLTYALGPIVLTRLARPSEGVRFFALLSVFVMAGFGLAPVLAAILDGAGYGVRDAFFLTSGFCVISAVLFFLLERPIRAHALTPGPEAPSRFTRAGVAGVLRSRAVTPVIMVCLGASVFAGMSNFQTVFADDRGLNYATFFLTYTITVVVFRLVLVRFRGGSNPYLTVAVLQYVMCFSVILFLLSGGNAVLYVLVAILFGLGYGVSYPILVAMAAQDAAPDLGPQTLQLFALTYFVGVFGFPLIAGWVIVAVGAAPLLIGVALLAGVEATMALRRGLRARFQALGG